MVKPTQLPYLMQSGGRWYYRRAGKTIRLPDPSDPGFLAAYDAAKQGKRPTPTRTTVAALIDAYQASNVWETKAPRTRKDYGRALAYLRSKIGDRDVCALTTPLIVEMMNANHAKGRTTFANRLLAVVSVLCIQAKLMGWMKGNPAHDVPRIKVPKERRAPHIPWPDAAVDLWRREAGPIALLAFELGVGTMQRPADWTRFRWRDYDGAALTLTQGKTGVELTIPVTPHLKAILDSTKRAGFAILTMRDGRPMTYKNLAEMMQRERGRLGTMAYDLHALRYRGIMELAWAGCTDDEIPSYSGHTTKAMIAKYAGKARQIMRSRQAAAKREQNRTKT